jgi:hypothetical protein
MQCLDIGAMAEVPDLVVVSKLKTQFSTNPKYTQHVQYKHGNTLRQRKILAEERWQKERKLGSGSFGIVRLEKCIYGDRKGSFRAVKKIQKVASINYYRELEAIALFSHDQASTHLSLLCLHGHDIDSLVYSMHSVLSGRLVGMKITPAFLSQWNISQTVTYSNTWAAQSQRGKHSLLSNRLLKASNTCIRTDLLTET